MYWLVKPHFELTIENKYLPIKKPIWNYGIQLWVSVSIFNIDLMQRYQNVALRTLTFHSIPVKKNAIYRDMMLSTIVE